MRVILDSNVWISALLFGGLPRQILALASNGKIQICSSEVLLEELEEVLSYQKLQKRIAQLGTTSEELLTTVRQLIQVYPIAEIEPVPGLRDQDDLIVLATAVAAQAVVIVSGDKDLLVLQNYSGVLIINVADFLSRYFPTE